MAYNFFALMARMKYIDRWGLMRNTQTENIQEHSHMVAVLAHALAVIGRERFGSTVDPNEAAVAGLYHDAPEILTGDLPTPVKYYNPEIQRAYKEVERVSCKKLLNLLPAELRKGYEPLLLELDETVQPFVKAADKLSAHIKCIEEMKAGNLEFESAANQTKQALLKMELPALQWFMDHCLDSFALNLDQLE